MRYPRGAAFAAGFSMQANGLTSPMGLTHTAQRGIFMNVVALLAVTPLLMLLTPPSQVIILRVGGTSYSNNSHGVVDDGAASAAGTRELQGTAKLNSTLRASSADMHDGCSADMQGLASGSMSTRASGTSTRASGMSTRASGTSTRANGTSTRASGTSTRASRTSTRANGTSTRASGTSTRGRKAWTSARTSGLAPGHAMPGATHGEPARGAVRNVSLASALSTLGGEATVPGAAGAFPAIASGASTCTDSVSPAADAPCLMAYRATRDHNTLDRADSSATHQTPKPQCHGTKSMASSPAPSDARSDARSGASGGASGGAQSGGAQSGARASLSCTPSCDARSIHRSWPGPMPLPLWCAQMLPPPVHTGRVPTPPLARRWPARPGVWPIVRYETMTRSSAPTRPLPPPRRNL